MVIHYVDQDKLEKYKRKKNCFHRYNNNEKGTAVIIVRLNSGIASNRKGYNLSTLFLFLYKL